MSDIIADLHMHSTWSDGKNTIREMVGSLHQSADASNTSSSPIIRAASASPMVSPSSGLLAQAEEVRRLNAEMGDVIYRCSPARKWTSKPMAAWIIRMKFWRRWILSSLRCIRDCSQKREQVTERLLNAIRNPHVDMIGHPSARQFPNRDEVDADWDAVLAAAKASRTRFWRSTPIRSVSISSRSWRAWRKTWASRSPSTPTPIAIAHLDLMDFGVTNARRGWVEARHVVNTWPFERFSRWFKSRR